MRWSDWWGPSACSGDLGVSEEWLHAVVGLVEAEHSSPYTIVDVGVCGNDGPMSQGVAILVFVLVEALHRVETAANEVLAAVNDGSLSNAEARQVLAVCKPAIAALVTAQTAAARVIAGTERHGDGGAQVLADSAGLTRREAHSQINTAETLSAAPVLRDAVESGRVSPANAKRLAEAISKTDADTVVSDGELLAQAVSLRPEQFTRVARRWTADHQADGGEGDYRRMRARRRVWFYGGDDGMTHMHAEFDPLTGQRIANRLTQAARRLHSADQRNVAKDQRRTLPQCLADALDHFTAGAGRRCRGRSQRRVRGLRISVSWLMLMTTPLS